MERVGRVEGRVERRLLLKGTSTEEGGKEEMDSPREKEGKTRRRQWFICEWMHEKRRAGEPGRNGTEQNRSSDIWV